MVEEQSHNGGNIAEEENIREREFSFLQFGFRYFILHDCFLRNEECQITEYVNKYLFQHSH